MDCIACFILGRAEKTSEGFGDVSWHGNVNILLDVIPVNGQSIVFLNFRVHGHFVIFFNSVQESINAGIGKLFGTKIINVETKIFVVCRQMPVEYFQGT